MAVKLNEINIDTLIARSREIGLCKAAKEAGINYRTARKYIQGHTQDTLRGATGRGKRGGGVTPSPPKPKSEPTQPSPQWTYDLSVDQCRKALCQRGAPLDELAAVVGATEEELRGALGREVGDVDAWAEQAYRVYRFALRGVQTKLAEISVTMAIHLGRQHLGQADSPERPAIPADLSTIEIVEYTGEADTDEPQAAPSLAVVAR